MRRSIFAFALLAAFGAAEAQAQTTATVGTTLSFTMQERLFIDVTDDNLVFTAPTTADLDAGYTQTVSHSVEHRGNMEHTITVAPDAPTWQVPLVGYPGTKPASDLEWSNDSGSSWNAVDNGATVGTGVRGGFGAAGNEDIAVDWRAAISYAEPAGPYQLTVTYTSTAN